MNAPLTPTQAWNTLIEGNQRFTSGESQRLPQSASRLADLSASQHPHAVVFGCSDSRVAAEIIFDQSLGEIFVVRTAGHVIDITVLGSLDYAVQVLKVPLVVILGHDHCGAVELARETVSTGRYPQGYLHAIAEQVLAGLYSVPRDVSEQEISRAHVCHTVNTLTAMSSELRQSIEFGSCAVVGLEYTLSEGVVRMVSTVGDVTT